MPKKLYRSKTSRRVSGVFGGLGDYFGIDSTLLRIAYVFLALLTGFVPAIIAYIIAAIIIPEEGDDETTVR